QTDYTCIPFWGEPEMDAFFAPHKDLVDECVEKGIKREKVVVTGIPVSMRFYDKPTKKAARETLSLPQDKEIYLVMTGSMGFGNMTDLVKNIIIEGNENTYVVALVGSNEELKKELLTAIPREKLLCVDFTNDVPVYMSACDVLLTKPGGLSSTEAAACNVPFIHTAPIPGCETKNALFFANMGASICKETPEDSAKAAVSLMKDKTTQQKMLIAQRENINPFAARDIVDYAIANANL
ncbi:MAG: glycosyltransferase, partial [Oscillospiraceae bacterium]